MVHIHCKHRRFVVTLLGVVSDVKQTEDKHSMKVVLKHMNMPYILTLCQL